MGLGENIRGIIRKFSGGVADEASIKELIKELQRTLISNDVNVKLVLTFSKALEEQCLVKRHEGLGFKEFVVSTVYEELVKILGEKYTPEVKAKKILLAGLFGSGKCVHPQSKVILTNGSIIEAKELYDKYQKFEDKIEDGYIIDVCNKNILVPSFNPQTLKIENKKITSLWKLEGKELLEVKLDNGNDFSVKVTPEHPFFVLRNGIVKQVRADQLTKEEYVAIPKRHDTESTTIDLYPYLKTLNLEVYEDPKLAKQIISTKYILLKNAINKLNFKRNYCTFTAMMKRGSIPIELLEEPTKELIKIKLKEAQKSITFPRYMTKELAEFLGYVIGDGHLGKNYIEITSEDTEVIERTIGLTKKLFNKSTYTKKDNRTKKTYHMIISSKTLVEICNKVFDIPIGKKGRFIKIPEQITKANTEIVSSFIRSYFDCDSNPNKNTRSIEITSESKNLISNTKSMLLRFGISSTISKKYVNDVSYFRLSIRSNSAEIYAEKIGYGIKRKQEIANTYKKIGILQGNGKEETIPLGTFLKKIRTMLGFSIGEIQNKCNSYGVYERKGQITRESLTKVINLYEKEQTGTIHRFLTAVKENPSNINNSFTQGAKNALTYHCQKEGFVKNNNGTIILNSNVEILQISRAFNKVVVNYLKSLTDSDVTWSKVTQIIKAENEEGFVYDLTVEDNHSFIADNIIVHNTTSAGKLAKYYSSRGLKVLLVPGDVHRPAAYDQLKQISEQVKVPFLDIKGKNIKDVLKALTDRKEKEDVIIFDTAGRSAFDQELADELKFIDEEFKPDEKILVVSGDIGQVAFKQATEFKKVLHNVTGVIATKMDGSAKGGGVLSAVAASGSRILFLGTGEKPEDLTVYDPKKFVSNLLGFPDFETLLEKAKEINIPKELPQKMDYTTFIEQMKSMKKMGPLKSIMQMMGVYDIPEEFVGKSEEKLKVFENAYNSMTKLERTETELMKERSRQERVAKGAGLKVDEVKEMVTNFEKINKMMKGLGKNRGLLAKLKGNPQLEKMLKESEGNV